MTRAQAITFRIITPLLVLAMGELVLRHVFDFRTRLGIIERSTYAAYDGVPWADDYFRDLIECRAQSAKAHQPRYSRYVLQDINENCATPTVNYAHRVRHSWNPDDEYLPSGATIHEVAMFGGSTMEGLGAIDNETIPSHFSKLANARGGSVVYHVTNYGVSGYTFTQSVVKLLTLLREGRHFDSVIFYDGANDVDYAYELGAVGALEGEDIVTTDLEGSVLQKIGQFGKTQINACVLCLAAEIAVRNTPILRDYLPAYMVKVRDAMHFKKGKEGPDDVEPFAKGIAEYYAQSHALLANIATAYGMRYLDFLQPSLMYEDRYAGGEAMLANVDPRLTDPRLRTLYHLERDDATALGLPNFYDLSHVLEGRSKACYLDAVHLSGEGNRVVAQGIYNVWQQAQSR